MDYGAQLTFALMLGIPVACIAWTVTQEEVFHEMRELLAAYRSRHRHSFWRRKLAYVPSCPYCFSHYVAALFIALLRFKMLANDWRGYVVSLFTLVLIANVYLTVYHMLRVGLRWTRSLADHADATSSAIQYSAARRPASIDLAETLPLPLRGRTARSLSPDRRA